MRFNIYTSITRLIEHNKQINHLPDTFYQEKSVLEEININVITRWMNE